MSIDRLIIRRPDDWHLHLRDGDMLAAVLGATARGFGRAVVMPNLVPPVATVRDAAAYRNRINRASTGSDRAASSVVLPDRIAIPGVTAYRCSSRSHAPV